MLKTKIQTQANNFIFNWHEFPIDYWWRKRYKVAFGSKVHREMSFIDMFIEYQEELMFIKSAENNNSEDEAENESLGLNRHKGENIPMTNKQIDEDYESIDLEQFDIK